jgi:hypothetical protein
MISPTELDFEQPMTLRPAILGGIGIKLFHRLTPQTDCVHLLRRLELTPHGLAALLTPIVTNVLDLHNFRSGCASRTQGSAANRRVLKGSTTVSSHFTFEWFRAFKAQKSLAFEV